MLYYNCKLGLECRLVSSVEPNATLDRRSRGVLGLASQPYLGKSTRTGE